MENNRHYYNLTHPQKRIWYIEKIYSGYPINNIGGCLKINGSIDFDILCKAINQVIKQNDGLRLRIIEKENEPYQFVAEALEQPIDFYDFSEDPNGDNDFQRWSKEQFQEPFIFENSPLYYFAMYKISDSNCGVLLKIHHVISDGWSVYYLIQKQVCECYDRLLEGQTETEDSISSYIDYIDQEHEYLGSDKFIEHKKYWMSQLMDVPDASLYKSAVSPKGKRRSFKFDSERSIALKNHLKNKTCSINEFFIAVLMLYLNKTTHNDDLTISLPVLNRSSAKYKGVTGMFISTMPFRLKLDSEMMISEYFDAIRLELKRNYRYQKYPYNLIMSDLNISARGFDSLFKVSLNCYNVKKSDAIGSYKTELEECYCGCQSYALQVVIKEWTDDDSISLNFDYRIEDYDDKEIIKMFKFFCVIVDQLVSNDNKTIREIQLLTSQEIKHLVYTKNETATQYPVDKTIHELFEEQVDRTPQKTALIHAENYLTYQELNERANRIAHFLFNRGIKKGSVVGILGNHSFELLCAMLGVLKSGAAYLPIDSNYPAGRINYMLSDSNTALILTNIEVDFQIDFGGEIVRLSDAAIPLGKCDNLANISDANDLAYIIYTSGSTGKPKGVMISHKSLVNYVWWGKTNYIKGDEIFAFYTSIAFDLTVTSIFIPLVSGTAIAIYSDDGTEFILDKILRQNIATIVKLTPSHLSLINERDNRKSSIKRFIVGGEDLKASLAKEIYDSFNGNIEIFNEYGPTEATVGCMIYKYNHVLNKKGSVPIGAPIANSQIYLLDKDLNVVPEGVEGEIYISGDVLALGYLNNPVGNERFVDNPFVQGQKMYQTGDISKYMEDGNMVYLGRKDNQVKIRGHRIELGEIEEWLLKYPKIKDAVVVINENSNKDKLLCAYLINHQPVTDEELSLWLSTQVPKYMIPSVFIFVDTFPLTVNGKIDVKSLLATEINHDQVFVAARNKIEQSLTDVMKQLLMVDAVSMKDNFYRLGGDSIKAIQMTSKLSTLGYSINLKDILTKDTIEEIASAIEIVSDSVEIDQGLVEGTVEKTPIIKWFLSHNFDNMHHYNQSIFLKLGRGINEEHLNKAIQNLVKQHDSLRLNYDMSQEVLFYNNEHLKLINHVKVCDLSMRNSVEQASEIEAIGHKLKSSFDVSKDLLLKACVFKCSEEDQFLLITAHHLVVDGVSWRIILEDLSDLLKQIIHKEDIFLLRKTHSYGDWAEQLLAYSKSLNNIEVWKEIEKVEMNFPTDYDLGEDRIKNSNTIITTVNKELVDAFSENINRIYNMTLNEGLIVALTLAINKFSDEKHVLLELEGHGRENVGGNINISRTVGWFTSIYPVTLQVHSIELEDNLKSLKDQLKKVASNGLDYGVLKYLKGCLGNQPKKHIRFNYLGDFDNSLDTPFFELSSLDSGRDVDENNALTSILDINMMRINGALKLSITYCEHQFKEETIREIVALYLHQIEMVNEHCSNKSEVEFTLSDFDTVELSQDDLDSLFSE
jgi:amino acid adenylation domain-containing protein/non-ribosomal peptide synthase protein (TIGR01720 family)